tara:strand:- start:256141 stop:256341 length:201 start_codon:yes stop_codon:yes gene_type:complete
MRAALLLAGVMAFSAPAFASETVTYTYDAQGRLVKVEHSGGPNDGVTTDYEYDDADNRTRKKKTGA